MATAHEKRHHEAVQLYLAILWEENHKSEMTLGGSNMAARMTYTLNFSLRKTRNAERPEWLSARHALSYTEEIVEIRQVVVELKPK